MTILKTPGVGTTVRFLFTTNGADGGAIAPSSAFEAADVRIYKDGGATQRSSEAGFTMTSPFDSVTGLHQFAADLSDDTDAGFYAVGSYYDVVLVPDETVDGVAVVHPIGAFRIVAVEAVAGVPKVDMTHAAGTAWGSGAITNGAIANDALTANKFHSDVTTEMQSGLATAAALATVDTVVDAIKVVTDALPDAGALTSPLPANIKEVNDVAITGDGDGTPWGPA